MGMGEQSTLEPWNTGFIVSNIWEIVEDSNESSGSRLLSVCVCAGRPALWKPGMVSTTAASRRDRVRILLENSLNQAGERRGGPHTSLCIYLCHLICPLGGFFSGLRPLSSSERIFGRLVAGAEAVLYSGREGWGVRCGWAGFKLRWLMAHCHLTVHHVYLCVCVCWTRLNRSDRMDSEDERLKFWSILHQISFVSWLKRRW